MPKLARTFFSRRMLGVFLLGISSGLPLLLIGSTLKAWMKEAGVDLSIIGIFALVGLPYTLKFLWAPLLDRYRIPFLDRRRGWILVFQIGLGVAIAALAFSRPAEQPMCVAVLAFIIAFFSASQDIAIDAYRREILEDSELGLGSSLAVNGYRVGMLLAGAVALPVADRAGWTTTYLLMSAFMLVAIVATWFSPALTAASSIAPKSLREAVVDPFVDYFKRAHAVEILLFLLLYKLGDQMASDMLVPFYLDTGFTKTEIGVVSKFFGFWAVIAGGLLGGILILKMDMRRALWTFGLLQAASTLGFAVLGHVGHSNAALAAVVAFENITSGMGTAAHTGFTASLCDRRFTATQYALLSSFVGVPRVFLGSSSGFIAKHMGWSPYFVFCAIVALPGLLLLLRADRWKSAMR